MGLTVSQILDGLVHAEASKAEHLQ